MLRLFALALLTFGTPMFQSAAFFGSNYAPSGGGGSISFIAVSTKSNGATPTPVITTTSLNVLAGDKLIVFAITGGSNNTLTVTDSSGDTFGKGTHQNDGSLGNTDLFYTVAATSNSSVIFTLNSSNSANFGTIIALQYRGGATSSINDAATNAAGIGGAWTSPSFSTVAAPEVVVQCSASSATMTAGNIGGTLGTIRAGGAGGSMCQDVIFSSTHSSITGVINIPGTGSYNGQLGSFK